MLLPIGALALLAALGLALGRKAGVLVACLALGLLRAAVAQPEADAGPGRLDRPLAAQLRIESAWRAGPWGWGAPARLVTIRQAGRVEAAGETVWLALPGAEPPPSSSRLRVRGALRSPRSYRNGGTPAGVERPLLQVPSRRLVEERGSAAASERARRWLEARLGLPGCAGSGVERPGAGRATVRALLFGDPSCLDPDVVRGLRRVGLGHLLAVSGLHVGLLLATLTLASSPLPRGSRGVAAGAGLVLLWTAVGSRPSLLRALAGVILLQAARSVARRPVPANSLAVAAVALVGASPSMVHDLGFQLSFAAAAGIVLCALPPPRHEPPASGAVTEPSPTDWRSVWSRARQRSATLVLPAARAAQAGISVTLAAQAFTLPSMAAVFGHFSPGAALLNLVALPWTALALSASLLAVGWALVSGRGLEGWEPLLDRLAAPFAVGAALPAAALWSLPVSFRLPPLAVLGGALVLAAVGRRGGAFLLIGLALLTSLPGDAVPPVEVVMFDVGQGDALLVRDGPVAVLVDGGGSAGRDFGGEVLAPALARLGVRRLDLAVVSHGDVDHCGGLADLVERIPVERLWLGGEEAASGCVARLHRGPLRPESVVRGSRLALGATRIEVLWPPGDRPMRGNDASVVLRVTLSGGERLLLTGDVEARAERRLVREGRLAADLLKVPHHGSRTSTTPALLAAVAPRLALISAGRGHRYGHPHAEVVERLQAAGVAVWRSDLHGRIRLRPLGNGHWSVRVESMPAGRLEHALPGRPAENALPIH